MFTGIITSIGTIISARSQGDLTVTISCDWPEDTVHIGESIAVNGTCLTVTGWRNSAFTAQLSAETISRTAPRWEMGEKVNLERALKMGDALDGHLVTGHVDGAAKIIDIKTDGDSHIVCLESPAPLSRYLAEKGSVTLDGISLTVNKVDGAKFWVNIIPHTWQHTNLSTREIGNALNIEIDMIARYVERLLTRGAA